MYGPSLQISNGRNPNTAHCEKQTMQAAKTWLELLPSEVPSRIADGLNHAPTLEAFMSFAETCSTLRQIALQVAGDDFDVGQMLPPPTQEGTIDEMKERRTLLSKRWEKVIGVESQNFVRDSYLAIRRKMLQTLSTCEWGSARFEVDQFCVVTLRERPGSKSVKMRLKSDFAWQALRYVVDSGIRELSVRCVCSSKAGLRECFVKQIGYYLCNDGLENEAKVESISMSCNNLCSALCCYILGKFQHLRRVTLHAVTDFSDELAAQLQSMGAVHLHNISIAIRDDVLKQGRILTTLGLEDSEWFWSQDHFSAVSSLSTCTNLKSFKAALTCFERHTLIAGIAALPSTLRELHLDFLTIFPDLRDLCCEKVAQAVVSFVRRCPSLSILRLPRAVLKDNVVDILNEMGPRLVELYIPVLYEELVHSLQLLMETVSQANYNIRKLMVGVIIHFPVNSECTSGVGSHRLGPEDSARLRTTLRVLRGRAPFLDTSSLEKAINMHNTRISELENEGFITPY